MPSTRQGDRRSAGRERPGPIAGLLPMVLFGGLFRRMFKKKVKKRGEGEEEEEGKAEKGDQEKGRALTKKDLEDWARLQQVLKEKEGTGKDGSGGRPTPPPTADGGEGGKGADEGGERTDVGIRQGYNYLYEEFRPNNAFKGFLEIVHGGTAGLCITHTYPEKVRDMYDIGYDDIPIFWLSAWYGASQEFLNIGTEERTLRPTRLDFEIMKEISNFMKKNRGNGVLLLDGIEALVLANNFEKVVGFLTNINNMASANQCTTIAPINPGVFRKRDRFILQKIFDEVRTFVDESVMTEE